MAKRGRKPVEKTFEQQTYANHNPYGKPADPLGKQFKKHLKDVEYERLVKGYQKLAIKAGIELDYNTKARINRLARALVYN